MNPGSHLRHVQKIASAQPMSEGAGVRMRRTIGAPSVGPLDPFLMLDEFKSDRPDDYLAGFPDHPHRGFETVTYMLAGYMQHRDHKGNEGSLGPGSVQWMTAGRGIVHSEMPQQKDGLMWGFQLWVNLPAREKLAAPRYQDIPAEEIPKVCKAPGASVRVLAGEFEGVEAPVTGVAIKPLYLDVRLPADGEFIHPIPDGHTALCYVYAGELRIGEAATAVAEAELAVLSASGDFHAFAPQASRFLLLAGKPLNEPIVWYGPFVMNTREQINQAIDDYRTGRF